MFRYTPNAAELCPGEYPWVARKSRDIAALRRAHETSCTKAEAETLIRALARELLPAPEAAALRLTWGSKRGRGGVLAERKREVRFRCELTGRTYYKMRRTGRFKPYISLPQVPLEPGGGWWVDGSSRLRVGLVLHEFAHVLTFDADEAHGPIFVAKLDALVTLWEEDLLPGAEFRRRHVVGGPAHSSTAGRPSAEADLVAPR